MYLTIYRSTSLLLIDIKSVSNKHWSICSKSSLTLKKNQTTDVWPIWNAICQQQHMLSLIKAILATKIKSSQGMPTYCSRMMKNQAMTSTKTANTNSYNYKYYFQMHSLRILNRQQQYKIHTNKSISIFQLQQNHVMKWHTNVCICQIDTYILVVIIYQDLYPYRTRESIHCKYHVKCHML